MSKSVMEEIFGKQAGGVHLQLVAVTCAECGIVFGIEQSWYDRLLDSHKQFWCTNGHTQYFGYPKPKADKVKKPQEAPKGAAPKREANHA